jgi:uncharacterized membrane protein (DUF106 family)
VNNTVGGWFSTITKSMSMDNDSMTAELKMLNKLEKEAEILQKSSMSKCTQQTSSMEDIDHTGQTSANIFSLHTYVFVVFILIFV